MKAGSNRPAATIREDVASLLSQENQSPSRHGIADAMVEGVKKFPFLPKLDPLGVKTGLELAAGGFLALLLMRWFGM